MFEGLFNKIVILKNKSDEVKLELTKQLKEAVYFEGEQIYQQNQSIDYIYLIY